MLKSICSFILCFFVINCYAQFQLNDYTFTSFVRVEPYLATKSTSTNLNRLTLNSAESNSLKLVDFLVEQLYINIETDEVIAYDTLIYPNPLSAGSVKSGSVFNLGFYMANAAAVELFIYDMAGQLRFKQFYDLQRDYQGSNAYNLIDIDINHFHGDFSAGAYFFVLVVDDAVVGQGKFGVKP